MIIVTQEMQTGHEIKIYKLEDTNYINLYDTIQHLILNVTYTRQT